MPAVGCHITECRTYVPPTGDRMESLPSPGQGGLIHIVPQCYDVEPGHLASCRLPAWLHHYDLLQGSDAGCCNALAFPEVLLACSLSVRRARSRGRRADKGDPRG